MTATRPLDDLVPGGSSFYRQFRRTEHGALPTDEIVEVRVAGASSSVQALESVILVHGEWYLVSTP